MTNCSDQMDFRSLEKIVKGAALTGLWSILDAFNRIDLEVLAVGAQHLASVLTACKANAKSFHYTDGELIDLDKRVGYMITYNPNGGCSDLPPSLQVLFRFVTFAIPSRLRASPAMLDRRESSLCLCPRIR